METERKEEDDTQLTQMKIVSVAKGKQSVVHFTNGNCIVNPTTPLNSSKINGEDGENVIKSRLNTIQQNVITKQVLLSLEENIKINLNEQFIYTK